MGELVTPAEHSRAAVDDVLRTGLEVLQYVFALLEPHKVGNSVTVRHMGDKPRAVETHVEHLAAQQLCAYLH